MTGEPGRAMGDGVGEEAGPRCAVAAVDGFGRRSLFGVHSGAVANALPEVLAEVARVARHLREQGEVGRVELVDRETGTVLARRRVWP